jgi:hypothetical protein
MKLSQLSKQTALVLMTLAVSLTSAATGGSLSNDAVRKLENVIENNISPNYRSVLLAPVEQIRRSLNDLNVSIDKLENVVNNNLPPEDRRILNQKIDSLKAAIGSDFGGGYSSRPPPPVSRGAFCASACKTIGGEADLAAAVGAYGENNLLAQQSANDKLVKTYNCNWGSISGGCESAGYSPTARTCQYACKTVSGGADQTYTAIGQGSSELEAKLNAISALKGKYNCNWGMVKVTCQ